MSVSDRVETFDETTVGKDDQTKIVNSMESFTLAGQFHFMENQAVTQGLAELAEVKMIIKPTSCSQVQMMFIS